MIDSKDTQKENLSKITQYRMKKIQHQGKECYVKHFYTANGKIVTLALTVSDLNVDAEKIKVNNAWSYTNIFRLTFSEPLSINIGYSICVQEDVFNERLGENVASGRAIKNSNQHKFLSVGISEELFKLIGKHRSFESILNNAYNVFKKGKLKELTSRRPIKKEEEVTS